MIQGVSIIHGAKRVLQNRGFRPLWPDDLARHIRAKGKFMTDCFMWDGGIRSSISDDVINSYAIHLVNLYNKLNSSSRQKGITIIGKSLGAIIAELAI